MSLPGPLSPLDEEKLCFFLQWAHENANDYMARWDRLPFYRSTFDILKSFLTEDELVKLKEDFISSTYQPPPEEL